MPRFKPSLFAALLGASALLGGAAAWSQVVKVEPNDKGLKATVKSQPILAPSDANVAKPPANGAAVYGAIAKWPDWSGAWVPDAGPTILDTDAPIPLTPKYAAQLTQLRKDAKAGKYPENEACAPVGLPQIMNQRGPKLEFIYALGRIIIYAGDNEDRTIFTDGRKLANDFDPFFNGTSIGHWDNNALVIDSIGFLPDAQPVWGMEGTGKQKIHEKISQTGPDKFQDEITITDPAMFTKPYTYAVTFTRHKELDVTEDLCLSLGFKAKK